MKLDKRDYPNIIDQINKLARQNNYTKIFCKIPEWAAPMFYANGFLLEAQIPKCYENKEAAFMVSKFLNSDRLLNIETENLENLSNMLKDKNNRIKSVDIKKSVLIKKLEKNDVERISEIYREVFETYPFPIFNPDYIHKTQNEGVQYFGTKVKGKIVALASAEVDKEGLNAEMTDFATLPQYRGQNLSLALLDELEKEMQKQGIKTLYTIARLNSVGMNKTFLRMGYTYSGTLIKNTNIAGKIESMNVYYKHI